MTEAETLLVQDVHEEYKRTRSPFRVASRLDITLAKVKDILAQHPVEFESSIEPRRSRYGITGRPDLARYLVASKISTEDWNNTMPDIAKARSEYEAGTHDMVTGRDGENVFLYSIPRAIKSPRPNYFSIGIDIE